MGNPRRLLLLLILLLIPPLGCARDEIMLETAVIPRPVRMENLPGAFVIDDETLVRSAAKRTGELLAEALREATGQPVPLDSENGRPISLRLPGEDWDLGPEGYRLKVTPASVDLVGPPAGLFRGTQTIRQLLQGDRIPAVSIEDRPRFAWRGLHLDVARHFFPVEDVKRYIDALAFLKMNTFHWHLTEDQGWRIEIKRYPKLTEIGSKRAESPQPGDRSKGDGKPYGGFYTQDEIREVVAYATERFVTIVPEIELPGHAQAAIAAYPELGNTGEPLKVRTTWGVSRHVYNVEDSTFTFLENVLDEVMELFPGEFIHIGGDECPKDEWKASAKAQARMKAEGLKDEHELQSWFIRRIELHLNANGRRLIGWDEISEGGVAPNATVMLWRSWAFTPAQAVRLGHDVVMSPNSHCYFDYYQGSKKHEPEAIGGHLPLDRVYSFEPAPAELTEKEVARILGGQGNLWTEYMPDMDHVFYMAYPRGAALAEVFWSPRETRDFDDFLVRWRRVSRLLDKLGVNHRLVPPRPLVGAFVSPDASEVTFDRAPESGVIRYTLDGTVPTHTSPAYGAPIQVDKSATVTAALFMPKGRQSAPVAVDVVRAAPATTGELEPGLTVAGYVGDFRKVPDFSKLEPEWTATVDAVAFTGREPDDNFALRFRGYLKVDEAAVFTFRMGSDDGSVLRISEARVIDLDGPHGFFARSAEVLLAPGVYPIELGYFERGGAHQLELTMEGPGTLMRERE